MKVFVKALALIMVLVCAISLFAACNAEQDEKGEDNKGVEYYITHNGTKIELDKKADAVLSALGAPKSTASLGDCGGFGTQTRYTYDNFVVYTVKNDSGESIDQISLSNDIVETPKGICIGDSSADVIKAYGEPTAKTDTKLEYETGSLVLKFGLDGTDVKSIDFIRITNSGN